MDCVKGSELMSLSLDRQLSEEDELGLSAHLAVCPRCREEWAAIERLSAILTSAPPVAPPPDFTAKVMRQLGQREIQRRALGGGVLLLLGMMLLWSLALPPVLEAFGLLQQLITYPSLLDKVLRLALQLVSVARSLGEAVLLVGAAIVEATDRSVGLLYSLFVLSLTALWIRVLSRYQPSYRTLQS